MRLVTFCLQLCWATVKAAGDHDINLLNEHQTHHKRSSFCKWNKQIQIVPKSSFLCHFSRSVDEWQIGPCWNVPGHLLQTAQDCGQINWEHMLFGGTFVTQRTHRSSISFSSDSPSLTITYEPFVLLKLLNELHVLLVSLNPSTEYQWGGSKVIFSVKCGTTHQSGTTLIMRRFTAKKQIVSVL